MLGLRCITAPEDAQWAAAGWQRGSAVIAVSHSWLITMRVTAALTCGVNSYSSTYMVGIDSVWVVVTCR